MDQHELIPHLFRKEFSKIAAVLSNFFGIEGLAVAEDIASETFLLALETWTFKGIPENPTAWLHRVAQNKAKNYIHRNRILTDKVAGEWKQTAAETREVFIDLSDENILDSQLQMLFALCHPSISVESQIGLSLRILCGFGIDEIASAFLTNKETINKRLFRAKAQLRIAKVPVEVPADAEINNRLETVLTTLYLLFNEGYYSESQDIVLREDLCLEAMRLTGLLMDNTRTNLPSTNALYALMCFHASRFKARKGANGEIILYHDQDETQWNKDLIARGSFYLHEASHGDYVSKYHIEASIAYWFTIKEDTREKWSTILELYNRLLITHYSPVAALNRTYALSMVHGKPQAIIEAEKLKLEGNHFYFTLLGELYKGNDNLKARAHFQTAYALARTRTDKQTIQTKIDQL